MMVRSDLMMRSYKLKAVRENRLWRFCIKALCDKKKLKPDEKRAREISKARKYS